MQSSYDVILIGSGINSLVAAAKLGAAGRRVAIFEQHDDIGGFIASGQPIHEGYTHDLYSSWHPLFTLGPAYAEFGEQLHGYGLEYCNTDGAVTASIATGPDGRSRTVVCYRDPERTVSEFEHAADRDAYLGMLGDLEQWAPVIFGALGSELRPWNLAKIFGQGLKSAGQRSLGRLARQGLMSGRNYTRASFTGWEVDQLWTPWLLHAGLGPDAATGGAMLPVMAGSMHQAGLPIVAGGAENFLAAFRRLLSANGVEIFTGEAVERIELTRDTVSGIRTASGRTVRSGTVLASVGARALYERLLPQVPALVEQREQTARFQMGRGAMQIHLTLAAPVPWTDAHLAAVPLIHLSDGSNSTAIACAQAEAGLLPAEPTVVVGQQSVLDPSRAPTGAATLWIQLQEVPYAPVADAAGELDVSGGWTESLKSGYLDRVLRRLAEHAPGIRELVTGSLVLSPADLEARNPNAVNGDPYGGGAELYQNLLWRPLPGGPGWNGPVKGLYHIGAAVHPGPGLGGGSGYLAAANVLKTARRK